MSSAGWMLLICSLVGVWSLAGFCYYKLLFEDDGDAPAPAPRPAASVATANTKAEASEMAEALEEDKEAE